METTNNNGYMKGFVPFAIAAAVISLAGGFTSAVPANVVADWGLEDIWTTWITLAYSFGAASMAPILGKLNDVWGRRKTIYIGTILFAVGEALIGFCPTSQIILLILFRFIAGCGAAMIAPVAVSYIMTQFPPEKIGSGFTLYMTISCATVIFGPFLGGLVLQATSWRMVMYIVTALCVIVVLLCLVMVKKNENEMKGSMAGFDWGGAVIGFVFFCMVLCIPTFGQGYGWTGTNTLIAIAVAVVSLILLFVLERKAANPILNGKFMGRKEFILPVIILFLTQGLMQGCMQNIIVFCIYTTGSRALAGYATSVMYIGMTIGTIVLGPMAEKKEPRYIAAAALVCVAVGAGLQMLFSAQTGLALMCISLFLIGVGLGGNGTIFMKVALSNCAPEIAGSASGTYNVFRDLSAPFGVALFVPMFTGGIASFTAANMGTGMEQAAATVQACVSSIHRVAMVQVVCVIIGIVVCLMLPKIYSNKTEA